MFATVGITIGAYGSIFNHFQPSNQKSVLKNKWFRNFQKQIKNLYLPTLIFFFYGNQTIFFRP